MFDLDSYMNALILSCRAAFGERLLYVGLQGSYLRGEAHEKAQYKFLCEIQNPAWSDPRQQSPLTRPAAAIRH